MVTSDEYDRELEDMEREEHQRLDYLLELALMEEPYEKADEFRARLNQIRTLGRLRETIESKVREHGFLESEDTRRGAPEFC